VQYLNPPRPAAGKGSGDSIFQICLLYVIANSRLIAINYFKKEVLAMSDNNKAVELLINTGSNLAGAVAGSALGFLMAGPVGAIAGGTVGSTLRYSEKCW
jgi:TRAP-type mannitol/chloroaromatic compound transport system permease large subunit